jgi:two-component system alkaline phosphatase synthesis response regulator PhoP
VTARVLVVDDEPAIRELCRVNLELDGHEVLEAGTGEEALEIAARERLDLVFLDVMLPGIDGWEVLRRLKDDPATAPIAVVLLTARTSEDDQILGWTGGILDYLGKPFEPRVLGECVTRALEPRDPEDEEAHRRRILDRLATAQELRARSWR